MFDSMKTSKNVSVYFTPVIMIEVISFRLAIRISSGTVFAFSNVGSSWPYVARFCEICCWSMLGCWDEIFYWIYPET
jgi:hypothetical protein